MPASKQKASSAKKEQQESVNPETKHVGTEDALRVYSNAVTLQSSPWDIRLNFGQIERTDADGVQIHDKVLIYMSPQHAKATLEVLRKTVERYEGTYGTLPLAVIGEEDQ